MVLQKCYLFGLLYSQIRLLFCILVRLQVPVVSDDNGDGDVDGGDDGDIVMVMILWRLGAS
jgi:hypothetical protein